MSSMTTDITELAQREKYEAWAEHACAAPWGYLKKRRTTEGYSEQIYTCMWTAWKAAGAELVEALEKAQRALDKIKSSTRHVDTSEGVFIPNSLDAWGRPVPQFLPYDFSGNPGVSATQYCNGWNDAGGYWLNYVRELESRTVKLPVGYTASSGHPFNEAERTVMIPGGGDWLNRFDVEHVLTADGIKWEDE